MATKSAVMVDLVGYSRDAAVLEGQLGVAATAMLNRQIQGLIRQALLDSGSPSDALVTDTGDGALLVFDAARQAVAFAAALHGACHGFNRGRDGPGRHFRIGIGTGDIQIDRDQIGGRSLAGMAIVTAARLEAKADPGGVLIDASTHAMLPPDMAMRYAGPETIVGKRAETFAAWRAQYDEQAKPLAAAPGTQIGKEPTRLINMDRATLVANVHAEACKLRPEQFDLLIIMVGIPNERAPSFRSSIAEQATVLIKWAAEAPEGLAELWALVSRMTGGR